MMALVNSGNKDGN